MLKQLYRFLNPHFQNLFLEYKVDFKPRYGSGASTPPHQDLFQIINSKRDSYSELVRKALSYSDAITSIRDARHETNHTKPVWNNGYLPGLDIIMLYTIVAESKPQKYLEIGSGNSTKVVYKAKKDLNLDTKIISIDPKPRIEIDDLADMIIRKPLECLEDEIVEQLGENDILFVDNSHRILPNSDSTVFFLEILPKLKKGVLVHLHDIYLPYDYPQVMCDRFYSEQYGLAICLLANHHRYETLMPNYFVSQDQQLAEPLAPIWNHPNLNHVEKHGGSFWLRIF